MKHKITVLAAFLCMLRITSLAFAQDAGIEENQRCQEVVELTRIDNLDRDISIAGIDLGSDHPDAAMSLNSPGTPYNTQGLYAKAESLYKRSLAICEETLGPDHPNVAKSLNNLAVLYDNQGLFARAEPLYKRSLAIKEKARGRYHPDLLITLENLTGLYRATRRNEEANELERWAAHIRRLH